MRNRGNQEWTLFQPIGHLPVTNKIGNSFNLVSGMGTMIKADLNRFEEVLKKRVGELERTIRHRDGIAIERTADHLEETQRAAERTLAVINLDRESRELRNARTALARIQDGSYGACLECEEDIHPKRFAAMPWASAA